MQILRTLTEGDAALVLRRRGPTLELLLGNVVLMSSAAVETERVFGRLAAAKTTPKNVLVGGLGFGATLRGVLDVAGVDAKIVVVEKLSSVIGIARNEAADLVGGALDDARVVLTNDDISDVIASADDATFDAILLDVDNGPQWASFQSNARLYSEGAVRLARTKLAKGGIYAVWSGFPAHAFTRILRRAGLTPRIVPLHERGVVRARAYVGSL